ncbi:MAG: serine protease [Lysobacterales bacterium CG17_big_fil_post_rev_8_21_14_2_50_64_11]|nr:MAG: serine protease [Xanthomonadales bacterium CG17_big_fil_post_rev_8_21_14_2_50_64_11]PIX60955.1 MAG: serine protease [Xanthomonadales bacterium CG_4_10_14_3_um_filter_64_11]
MKVHVLAAGVALGIAALTAAGSSVAAPATDRFLDVIVTLHNDAQNHSRADNRALAAEVARQHGVSATHTYGKVLTGFAARVPEATLDRLRADPMVANIEFDREMHAVMGKPGGGGGSTAQVVPWGVSRIGASANANDGAGIHVYIIDTGIDSDHPDLAAHIGNGFAAVNCKGRTCTQNWDDDNGHGTHVSGSAAAINNSIGVVGVAPGATLHAVKVLSSQGSGSISGIITGIDWMTAEVSARGQAAVANMSLGGGGSKTGTCTSSGFSGTDTFHQAICNAKNAGVVFAVAAGNDGADAEASTPAAYDDAVITVSATQQGDNWPTWSNWGDGNPGGVSLPVVLAAPGVSILSTWNNGGTNTISGTSMASPHVAGAAALYLKSHPQAANGSAFGNTLSGLLGASESTATFSNTSGHPHDEDFLDAGTL